jgi:hypothetical protein
MKSKILLAIAFVVCCATTTLPPPAGALSCGGLQRLYLFDTNFYRSWQPSEDQFEALVAQFHIKTVIKLNYEIEGIDIVPKGVNVIYLPIDVLAEQDVSYINHILDELDKALLLGPVLLHCSHGEDRTGLIAELHRVRHQPYLTKAAAWNEMVNYGFHDGVFNKPGLPKLVAVWVKMTGYDPTKS